MLLDIDFISHTKSFIEEDEAMCATGLGWSELTTEERVKIIERGRVVKGVEMGEWHVEGQDYVRWAKVMFIETGLCLSKAHYDCVFRLFSSIEIEDLFQKVVNNKDKTIFQYNSTGRTDEIENLLAQLRHLRMVRFDKDHTPELITVMYSIKVTDKEKDLLAKLHHLGFPDI